MKVVLPELVDLVPHREPMLLLDRAVAMDDDEACCEVTIRPTSSFVEDGCVENVVALEYMAQTIAAHAGYSGWVRGEPVRIGYLVGVRLATFHVPSFLVGDTLRVVARRVFGGVGLGAYECSVTRDGHELARATISVARPDQAGPEES